MVLEYTLDVSNASWSTWVVLLFALATVLIVMKTGERVKKRAAIVISLAVISTTVLTIPGLFSKYGADLTHASYHVMFSFTILLCAQLLLTGGVPTVLHPVYVILELGVFDRLQYALAEKIASLFNRVHVLLEIGVFDRLQYALAEKIASFSSSLRKTHTGNLNFNMLALLLYLLLSVVLILLLP